MTPRKKPEDKLQVGRPSVIDDRILQELIKAFAGGHTDEEACQIVGIAPATLYNYQNRFPEFVEQKELLKLNPFIKARQTIVKSLLDPEYATWFLERKGKNEFGTKTSVEYSNADAEGITNAEIIKSAVLALPPEERAAIVSEVSKPPDEVKPV